MKIPMALWARLMPLLGQALDLPRPEREAWLEQQHLDEDTAAALRQLLADREQLDSGDFMAELPKLDPSLNPSGPSGASAPSAHGDSAAAASQPSLDAPRASQSGLFAGDLLGPYRLIRQLGQGGMSVVWLAERDDGQMRRHVALKMPHAGPGQALLAERLRRERDILASLEHRHIARLYDVGTTSLGLPFLVLEYIEGQTLPEYCDERKLSLRERLKLFLQVLSAVQYAHTKLVLHRDLKPSNIMVNGQGEVKLLDFGIAKLIKGSETGTAPSTELTQHNGHVLTPDYAAPEQIAGAPLTTASDVYALGVILFELLTGQRPYRLPRGTRGALEEAILATDPRRPSQVWQDADVQTHHMSAVTLTDLAEHYKSNPRKLSQLLRGDLDVIVATALQKQAARRYPTAQAFAQDIGHHLAKEPIAAQPDSRWYRTRKYVQRHAWSLTAAGAVVMALSVGLGLALWQAKEARQEAAKANAIKDFLVGLFENGDVEQADALRKRQQTVEQLLVNSANALGTQLKDQPQVRVELQGVVGGLLHNLAITDAAIKLRQQRVEQLEAMGASVAERAQAFRDLADSQDARGDTAGAKATLEKGLALCKTVSMKPVDVCYGLQVGQGLQLVIARDLDGADRMIQPALETLHSHARGSAQLAEALVAKGDLLSLKNDNSTSFRMYEEAMGIRAALWGKKSVRLAQERYLLAMSLAQVGRFAQARQEMDMAYKTMVSALGADNINSAVIELQRALLAATIEMPKEVAADVNHAYKIIVSHPGEVDSRAVYSANSVRARVALYDGRLGEVAPYIDEAMRMQVELKDRIPLSGHLETAMAWYLDDLGKPKEARVVLERARRQLMSELGAEHPNILVIDEAIGSTYMTEGDLIEAEHCYQQHPDSQGRAALLMEMGRFDEAEPIVRAQYDKVMKAPRQDQFRVTVYSAIDQMGRLTLGLGKPTEAKSYFEQAMNVMANGFSGNPYLLETKARYGLSLLALNDIKGAVKQALLVENGFKRSRQVAAHFKKPLHQLLASLRQRCGTVVLETECKHEAELP